MPALFFDVGITVSIIGRKLLKRVFGHERIHFAVVVGGVFAAQFALDGPVVIIGQGETVCISYKND